VAVPEFRTAIASKGEKSGIPAKKSGYPDFAEADFSAGA
jgi:hypothetical protein